MIYSGQILLPPRAFLIHRTSLENYDGWVGQLKLNDTRCLAIYKEDQWEFWNRHAQKHKQWTPTGELIEQLNRLIPKNTKACAIDCLLLHAKSKMVKNTLCLLDILAWDGEYLFHSVNQERWAFLKTICKNPKKENEYALLVDKNLWLSKNLSLEGAMAQFQFWEDKFPMDNFVEGIVLKNPNARLGYHFSKAECGWQAKIRYECKKYLW